MQDLIRQANYQFAWQVSGSEGAYRAPSRADGMVLSLAADGFHTACYRDGEPLNGAGTDRGAACFFGLALYRIYSSLVNNNG